MASVRRPLAFVALLAAAACAHPRPVAGAKGDDVAEPDPGPTTVVFSNQSQDQADLYAVANGGIPVRIGTVYSGRTDTLVVRAGVVPAGGDVEFIARILTRRAAPRSGSVNVQPGDWISITLPPTQNVLSVLPVR